MAVIKILFFRGGLLFAASIATIFVLMTFKEMVHAAFLELAYNKIKLFRQNLDDLHQSAANETKSTAGDKHETALAMLQIEQAQLQKQKQRAEEQKSVLDQLNPKNTNRKIFAGSLLQTNNGWFYISTSLGKISVDKKLVTAISMQSPLGAALQNKEVGDVVTVSYSKHKIEMIL